MSKEKIKWIYVLKMQGFPMYKIGMSRTLEGIEKRLKQCQTGNPFTLEVYAKYEIQEEKPWIESMLHHRHKQFRMQGEWFMLNQKHIDIIDQSYNQHKKSFNFY